MALRSFFIIFLRSILKSSLARRSTAPWILSLCGWRRHAYFMEWSSFYRYAYFLHFERRLEALPAGFLLAVLHPHDRFYCPFLISRALQVSVLLNLVVTKIVAPARSLILNASCRHEPLANMTSPVCAVGKVSRIFFNSLVRCLRQSFGV